MCLNKLPTLVRLPRHTKLDSLFRRITLLVLVFLVWELNRRRKQFICFTNKDFCAFACSLLLLGANKHLCNRPFPSSCLPPLESESKCKVFVMVIISTLHMNEN